jgi:hypothetical protein
MYLFYSANMKVFWTSIHGFMHWSFWSLESHGSCTQKSSCVSFFNFFWLEIMLYNVQYMVCGFILGLAFDPQEVA